MNGIGTPSRANTGDWSPVLTSLPWQTPTRRKGGRTTMIGLFLSSMLLGLLVANYPSSTTIVLVAAAVLLIILTQAHQMGIETWQTITLLCLSGYVVLNYGFENLSVPIGPLQFLPVGELLMGAALALAVLRHSGRAFRRALASPPILCILGLFLLSVFHLVVDVQEHGLYALRDSTFSFEALFLLVGIVWAAQERNVELLAKWLVLLFIVTTIYSYTFPWAEWLQTWSPTSGPFHAVPLLGNYQELAVYLLAGALFCIWVAPSVVKWPRWVLRTVAVVQLAGLGILQSRSMFVGITVVLLLLFLLRETTQMSRFLSILGWTLGALVLAIVLLSASGWKVQGRLGAVDVSSLTKEVKSIWPSSAESVELGHESDRRAWYGEVWNKVRSSPRHLLFGVGYGEPLVDFLSDTGQPIRQPHNSSLNVFGRLGFVGLSVWLLFVCTVVKRLWSAVYKARRTAGVSSPLHLWLFTFAVLGLLDSLVQPYFEFSHSAVPFFFLVGVALGMDPKVTVERATRRSTAGISLWAR